MKLEQLINQYIIYRKSLGEKFRTNETYLRAFCKMMGASNMLKNITKGMIHSYLYGNSTEVTSSWFIKHTALSGFYHYVLTRNYISEIPLPNILPKRPQPFVPYIYSKKELKCLFDMALTYQKNRSHISPYTIRTMLIITYALGLRIRETLAIKMRDIDLNNSVITIQPSKFYKSRIHQFILP